MKEWRKQDRGGKKAKQGYINELVITDGAGCSPTGDLMKNNIGHTSELSHRG